MRQVFCVFAAFLLLGWVGSLCAKQPTRMVFAHYMVCCPAAGSYAGLEDFLSEMRLAQSFGVDGFSLNVGGWEKSEPHYKRRVLQMYRAAELVDGAFSLFISVDGAAVQEIDNILETTRDLPRQLKVDGKPVISTFGGEGGDGALGLALQRTIKGRGFVFVPYFFPRPFINELPEEAQIKELATRYSDLDGYFYFGAAGSGEELSRVNTDHARVWTRLGKIYMASVTPYYMGRGRNFRVFETKGFSAMAREWEAAITEGAHWVQIVTWNDWYEDTYVAPFVAGRRASPWDLPNDTLTSHTAYLEASRYYIDWFKRGERPRISTDELYYFYRLHPRSLPVEKDPAGQAHKGLPDGADQLQDNLFATVFLKAPAVVQLASGNKRQDFYLAAGVHHVSVPFLLGRQKIALFRDGAKLLEGTGRHSISSSDDSTRFNYYGGVVR